MARLPEGKQKLVPGCYVTFVSDTKMRVNVNLNIKWYGWPFLMWRQAHKDYSFKWHQYPMLIAYIAKHTVIKWVGNNAA